MVAFIATLCVACGTEKFPDDLSGEITHSPYFISPEQALENLRNFEAAMPISIRSGNRTIKSCKPYSYSNIHNTPLSLFAYKHIDNQ